MKNNREEMPYTRMFERIRKTGLVLTALGVAGAIYGETMVSKINEQYPTLERYDEILDQTGEVNRSLRDYNVNDFASPGGKSALEEKIKQISVLNEKRERIKQLPDFQEQLNKRGGYTLLTMCSAFLGVFGIMGILKSYDLLGGSSGIAFVDYLNDRAYEKYLEEKKGRKK
ncbi:hypothetical protein HY449_04740 [Candidatus Pacearchaeota archaeon]|nr:hypothetical protein [Candidatus Pacearchaeota archaeon]